ncbi:maleylpyruvate isomerase N-terminal domain-containing protein [Mucilaginibacter sp. OK268]|uniref:maleylpyruvate isomerase N-terminal domain-containing protein n=1 Tax=Mucilaginibacter sp. OK268 TaxID=1881048 RepID=UPI000B86AF7E|nr:maleylpyruvate isomerase N-terminal domain-containing protein [Mucilaginibacter sp. OK268]
MNPIPIQTIHLFPVLDQLLIELLRSLSPDDWDKPTVAKLWTVKDIAAHLLHGNVRTISSKHSFTGDTPPVINSYQDLVNYLNEQNATWVKAMKQVSPNLLIQLLEATGKQFIDELAALDPYANARFSVAWAGEEQSANWFHIAREYTEKWHHQQQIRDAVNKPGIIHRELFYPCIATFMYALPYTYRHVQAPENTLIEITIQSEAGGKWYLQKGADGWSFVAENNKVADCKVSISPDIAWKLFTRAITPKIGIQNSMLGGNIKLGEKIFDTIAVIA